MDNDKFNMSMRKFLKQVGVTSQQKIEEAIRASGKSSGGALAGLTMNLPALTLAAKTSKKAAATGFDWDNADQVVEKIHEELEELKVAREHDDQANTEEELGDLLLAVTNLARHLNVNPEQALHNANRKFINRFEKLEGLLHKAGENWDELTLPEMEARWQAIKLNDGKLSDRAKPV